jgi:hypothetical protein
LRKVLDRCNADYSYDFPERTLQSLPATAPPRRLPRLELQSFHFPLPASARTALLEGGFLPHRDLREFALVDMTGLLRYAPEALVAPLGTALSLADQKQRGLLALPSLTMAFVVLTSLGDSPLEDHHRELLWRAFRVPVFEQLRGWDGAILARECEVHDGLHIEDAAVILHLHAEELLATQLTAFTEPIVRARTGLTGDIATAQCECGAETPRLRNLASLRANVTAATTGHR